MANAVAMFAISTPVPTGISDPPGMKLRTTHRTFLF
jgi:hypothetical protein